jgi:hypothetical protein
LVDDDYVKETGVDVDVVAKYILVDAPLSNECNRSLHLVSFYRIEGPALLRGDCVLRHRDDEM